MGYGQARDWAVTHLQVTGGPNDRRRWFVEAIRSYSTALGTEIAPITEAGLGSVGVQGEPMRVTTLRAALVAEQGATRAAVERFRLADADELAAYLITREKQRWNTIANNPIWSVSQFGDSVRERTVLSLHLLGAKDVDSGARILHLVGLCETPQSAQGITLSEWAHYLYPESGADEGMLVTPKPNFLASALIGICADNPNRHWVQRVDLAAAAEQDTNIIPRIARAAHTSPSAVLMLQEIIHGDPSLVTKEKMS